MRRATTQAVLAFSLAALSLGSAYAQSDYPSRSVRVIVPFPAGGSLDFAGRLVAQELTAEFGQSFVVENRPGAAGQIGTVQGMKAAPDGYTLVVGGAGTHGLAKPLYGDRLPYDPIKDFKPISVLASQPNVMVVPTSSPAKSVRDLIEIAKRSPGKLNYASSGAGTSGHLTMELFKQQAGVFITHIPYPGAGRGQTDVIAGIIDVMIENLGATMPAIKGEKVRALAVTTARRSPALPEIPTIKEATGMEFEVGSWIGLLAPAGTPHEIVEKLQRTIAKRMTTPEIRQRMLVQGTEVVASTPEEFSALIAADNAKWEKVIKAAKISIE